MKRGDAKSKIFQQIHHLFPPSDVEKQRFDTPTKERTEESESET